jgi:hypothetical protein
VCVALGHLDGAVAHQLLDGLEHRSPHHEM